jgi:hypothetical protein
MTAETTPTQGKQIKNAKSKKHRKEKTMNDHAKEGLFAPQLSRMRTFLFAALAISWFTEMVFLGFQTFSNVWTSLWQVVPPENPQLATALSVLWAVAAPAKGALFVMAVFGLRSKNPIVRSALFVSMAFIPPLNLVFPFRQQGFLLRPVAVATILSIILWGSFFFFREPAQQPEQKGTRGANLVPASRWETVQYIWFGAYSAALTLMAFLFMFAPGTALSVTLPCLSSLLNTHEGELPGLIHSTMASGTHLLALAVASWIATAYSRKNPALRKVMAVASTVHAGLFLLFPLRQIVLGFGANCAASSILVAFVPLLVGWLLYAAFLSRVELQKRQEAYI